MKTAVIIQARMSSTRLPGKVLRTVLGKSLLDFQIDRLRNMKEADTLVLATPSDAAQEPLWDFARTKGIPLFKGDENDVLARYQGAARSVQAELVVRVTSDCPLIDPAVCDRHIRAFQDEAGGVDYVSNTLVRSFPRGMDTEVFSSKVLQEAFAGAVDPFEREHVTPFIYRHPERYRLKSMTYPTDESKHRWTVDTPEDFELIKRLIEAVYPGTPAFTLEDLLEQIRRHPEWERLNAHIAQKA